MAEENDGVIVELQNFVLTERKDDNIGKDDLAGYWQVLLNRTEHYPHGLRDRQDVYDMTGNILVDYTLFGISE
jgi:hypothetical protein